MGCDYYSVEDGFIYFSDDGVGCLCTFPHNDGDSLSKDRVRSLALLGAAVVLFRDVRDDDYFYIPQGIPQWIQDAIDRALELKEKDVRSAPARRDDDATTSPQEV